MKVTIAYLGALGDEHRHPRHAIPPLRAGYAAQVLRGRGHEVELIDTAAPVLGDGGLARRLSARRPDLLVLDPRIENVGRVSVLAARLRAEVGALILAGPPAEASAAQLLGTSAVDGVLGGEYEGAIVEVAEALAAGSPVRAPGWWRRDPLGARQTLAPSPIVDLDALPLPPHDEFLAAGYELGYPVQRRGRLRPAYVLSTRGCPHACSFCSPVEMRSRFLPYRMRDVRAVVDELAWVQRLGANVVYFNDDNFLRRSDRVVALCEEILRRGLDLAWLADCRVDDVDPAVLALMRRAGCSTLCLGVESGSPHVLELLRKGITVEQTRSAARAIHDAGIWMVMFVILGTPGETEGERQATWRLLDELRPELVQAHRFAHYPMARGERDHAGWPTTGASKFVGCDGTNAPPLAFDQRDLYRRYYVSPRFMLDYVRTRGPYFPGPILTDARLALRTLSLLVRGVVTRLALGAVLLASAALVARAAGALGTHYEEAVPYVTTPLAIVDAIDDAGALEPATTVVGRWALSTQLPRLAVDVGGARLALLNQLYMSNHLSFVGVLVGRLGVEPLLAARLVHALLGVLLLLVLHDLGRGLVGPRAALIAVALAGTSLQLTFMFAWARFDESLPSVTSLVAAWAVLRMRGDPRARWRWIAALSVGLGVSAKITTLWPLAAVAAAGIARGWRPRLARPQLRAFAAPAIVAASLFVPMLGLAIASGGAAVEAGRRLAFLGDLFGSDAIPATARNLVEYLGSWDSLLGAIVRGPDSGGIGAAGLAGCALVVSTLLWLTVGVARPGPVPRLRRLETAALIVVGVLFALVALFYREHRDYQFVLLVPLFHLPVAAMLDRAAAWIGRRAGLPSPVALAILVLPALGLNLAAQARFAGDLRRAQNPMLDLHAQRASAEYLTRAGIARPITTTFYAVGQYELLTAGRVHPLHAFPLFRHHSDGSGAPDLAAAWRALLAIDAPARRWALLPRGQNLVEARHFAEADIRAAFLAQAARAGGASLRASFDSAAGEPLLDLYEVGPGVGPVGAKPPPR